MRDEDVLMILDFSGVPTTAAEKYTVYVASILYLRGLYHGAMKFDGAEAEGVIKSEGPYAWAGTRGEVFLVEFDENRCVKFMLPSMYEDEPVPENFVKLRKMRKGNTPAFVTAARTQPPTSKRLH